MLRFLYIMPQWEKEEQILQIPELLLSLLSSSRCCTFPTSFAFMEPYEASPSRSRSPPPSRPDTFHSCHTEVTMRSVHKCFLGSECPQWAVLSPGNQARSYFKSSPTCIALQIKITLHSSRKQHPTWTLSKTPPLVCRALINTPH